MSDLMNCPNCSADIRSSFTECPHCNYQLSTRPPTQMGGAKPTIKVGTSPPPPPPVGKGTVRHVFEGVSGNFTLRKITKGGQLSDKKIEFFDSENLLNREILDQGNKTITSKVQAIIKNENGRWFIENHSELKTTFIRLEDGDKMELKDGMVILVGNAEFLFKVD